MGIRSFALLFAIFAVAAFTQSVAPASGASRLLNCNTAKLKILTSNSMSNTTSTAYIDIPEATLNFVQGGSAPGCAVVRFSAQTFAKGNGMTIRPLLDVNTKALPPEVAFAGMDCSAQGCSDHASSFEFVFPSVAPGTHLLRMQFQAAFPSPEPPVYISRHNTVVQYQ